MALYIDNREVVGITLNGVEVEVGNINGSRFFNKPDPVLARGTVSGAISSRNGDWQSSSSPPTHYGLISGGGILTNSPIGNVRLYELSMYDHQNGGGYYLHIKFHPNWANIGLDRYKVKVVISIIYSGLGGASVNFLDVLLDLPAVIRHSTQRYKLPLPRNFQTNALYNELRTGRGNQIQASLLWYN